MNREIKFRGKRVDEDEQWIYGFYIGNGIILSGRYGKLVDGLNGERFEIIPESVGQYTGLKDKNGVDIYEGDILKFEGTIFEYEVKFEDGSFVGYHHNRDWGKWGNLSRIKDPDFANEIITIIGNIHTNPNS